MKNFIILLFVMLFASHAFGQKEGEIAEPTDTPVVKVDSISNVVDTAAVKADSITNVVDTAAVKVDSVAKTPVTTTVAPVTTTVAPVTTTVAPVTTTVAPVATAVAPVTTTVIAATTTAKVDSVIKAPASNSTDLDSLTSLSQLLTAKFNNVSIELEKYRGVYTVLKEKVLKRDFDPEKFSQIVDSIVAKRDSSQFGLTAASASLRDSLVTFKKEIVELKARVDAAKVEETLKLSLANELKTLKELLDSKILTQTEFDLKKVLVLQKWK